MSAKAKPGKARSAKAQPATTQPAKAQPATIQPAKAQPAGRQSDKAQPAGRPSDKGQAAGRQPDKAQPTKTQSAKARADKSARSEAKRIKRQEAKQRRRQMVQAVNMQRKRDKALIPIMLGVIVGCAAVGLAIGWFTGERWLPLVLGVMVGVTLAVLVLGRRMQRSGYQQAEGQPGAAGWALGNMRGQWRVTQGVAGTTQLDVVHRVLGRPGVILVGEGSPHRVRGLLAQEKKRTARLVGKIPIYDVIVGNEEGQVPLSKLSTHLAKLPRNITTQQMDAVEGRLNALGSRSAGLPKGPLPPGAKMRNVQRAVRRR